MFKRQKGKMENGPKKKVTFLFHLFIYLVLILYLHSTPTTFSRQSPHLDFQIPLNFCSSSVLSIGNFRILDTAQIWVNLKKPTTTHIMNLPRRVKEEFPASSSSFRGGATPSTAAPQPMEGLNEVGPPPFLTKTYEIIEDTTTNHIVSWSRGNNSFVVWDPQSFSLCLLPKYFKHGNFSSFVRQLNTYGFRKVDSDKWEFAHEGFLRGQKHLLKLIRRRKTLQPNASPRALNPACIEHGRFGLDREVDRLQRDKQGLMAEVVKVRQEQQTTKRYLQTMERRLKKTETRQQLVMNLLARVIQNPDFIQQLINKKHDVHKELEQAMINRKRRRHIDYQTPTCSQFQEQEEMSEKEDEIMDGILEREHLDEGFWDNLLDIELGFEEQEDGNDNDKDGDELVHQFGVFTSNLK